MLSQGPGTGLSLSPRTATTSSEPDTSRGRARSENRSWAEFDVEGKSPFLDHLLKAQPAWVQVLPLPTANWMPLADPLGPCIFPSEEWA